VQSGDYVLLLPVLTADAAAFAALTVTSTGTTPGLFGSQVNLEDDEADFISAGAYGFTASGSDASTVITIHSGTHSSVIAVALGAWSGASATQPDVNATPAVSDASASATAPAIGTATTDDWAVYLAAGVNQNDETSFSANPGTLRETALSFASNPFAGIADSNGSAGASGTSIGGGTWTLSGDTFSGWIAFTIGLKPAGGANAGAFFDFF
jgi:hypothetical protein